MSFDKSPPLRCLPYLAWVRAQPSVISGHIGCVAHHLIGHGRLSSQKTSDFLAIPLTDAEHKELHQHGWRQWESIHGSQREHALDVLERALRDGVLIPNLKELRFYAPEKSA